MFAGFEWQVLDSVGLNGRLGLWLCAGLDRNGGVGIGWPDLNLRCLDPRLWWVVIVWWNCLWTRLCAFCCNSLFVFCCLWLQVWIEEKLDFCVCSFCRFVDWLRLGFFDWICGLLWCWFYDAFRHFVMLVLWWILAPFNVGLHVPFTVKEFDSRVCWKSTENLLAWIGMKRNLRLWSWMNRLCASDQH